MARHSDAEVVARRGATLVLGGVRKDVPALVIDDNEAWQAKLAERFGELWSGMSTSTASWADIISTVSSSMPAMIELIVAYDLEGHTGGVEWIRKNATPDEVYEAFKEIMAASYPFARDLAKFPALIGQVLAQVSASSTNSPSPNGASPIAPS